MAFGSFERKPPFSTKLRSKTHAYVLPMQIRFWKLNCKGRSRPCFFSHAKQISRQVQVIAYGKCFRNCDLRMGTAPNIGIFVQNYPQMSTLQLSAVKSRVCKPEIKGTPKHKACQATIRAVNWRCPRQNGGANVGLIRRLSC